MENSSYMKDKEKYIQDLERYEYIVGYFEKNPSRVFENINHLDDICSLLKITSPKNIDISDENIQEKMYFREKSSEIINRLKSMNLDNLIQKLQKINTDRIKC